MASPTIDGGTTVLDSYAATEEVAAQETADWLELVEVEEVEDVTLPERVLEVDHEDTNEDLTMEASGLETEGVEDNLMMKEIPEIEDEDVDNDLMMSDYSSASDDSLMTWPTLHHRIESSYMPGVVRPHPADRTGVNYDRCKPAELKQFVVNRRLHDPFPSGVTLKYFYLRKLEAADRCATFRFMDLPPEMRLLTYRHLLTFGHTDISETPNGRLHTDILRTCKVIHAEAKNVLYDDNTFVAYFSVLHEEDLSHRCARVHKELIVGHCEHMKFWRLPHAIDHFPALFTRIAKLKVKLVYDDTSSGDYSALLLSRPLCALASFLMDDHRLKSVHVELELPGGLSDQDYENTLYPLRRLRNIKDFTLTDYAPDRIVRKLRSDLRSTEPTFNTVRLWKLLGDEAVAQLDLLETLLDDWDEDIDGESPYPSRLDTIQFRLYEVSCWQENFLNSRLEEKFQAQLCLLRNCLKEMPTMTLKSLVEDMIKKRSEAEEYEQMTDDGKLAEARARLGCRVYDEATEYESGDEWSDEDEAEGGQQLHVIGARAVPDIPTTVNTQEDALRAHISGAKDTLYPMLDSDQIDAIFGKYAPLSEAETTPAD